jgi:hypothetical protein
MIGVTRGETVVHHTGKVLFYGLEDFVNKICLGDVCFICGANRQEKAFNDEHVIPKWILRKYSLFDQTIMLPNQTFMKYHHYTVPCCSECNSMLGEKIEMPMSRLFSSDYNAISDYLIKNGPWLIMIWLCLLFFKTHYKDLFLRLNRDRRTADQNIGDIYEWSDLHHVYTVARTPYTLSGFDSQSLSSLFVLPAYQEHKSMDFDYCDLYDSQSVLVKIGNIAIVGVLNDGCAAYSLLKDSFLSKINDRLSSIQLREFLARASQIKMLLKNPPRFLTEIDTAKETLLISAEISEVVELNPDENNIYGKQLYFLVKDMLRSFPKESQRTLADNVLSGKWSFLFNEAGEFVSPAATNGTEV